MDIYTIKDSVHLFKLEEEEIDNVQLIFDEFESRTGIYIDPYGTSRLYCDHIKLIYIILEKNESKVLKKNLLKVFKENLENAIRNGGNLILEGD